MSSHIKYLSPWSHFHVDPVNGRIKGFTLDKCERCGGDIQAPNSITLGETPARCRALGMTEAKILPPEGFYVESEAYEGQGCEACS